MIMDASKRGWSSQGGAEALLRSCIDLRHRDPARGLRLAERGLELARSDREVRWEALFLRERAHHRRLRGLHRPAVRDYERALALFEDLGDEHELARTLIGLTDSLTNLGAYERALETARRSEAAFLRLGDERRRAMALNNTGLIHHRTDEYRRALDRFDQARAIFEALGERDHVASMEVNRANALGGLGRFEEARALYRRCVAHYEGEGYGAMADLARFDEAELLFALGQYGEALRLLHDLDGRGRHPDLQGLVASLLSEIYLRIRLPEEALHYARGASRCFRRKGLRYEWARSLVSEALAVRALGRGEEALELLEEARSQFGLEGNRYRISETDVVRAQLALEQGDLARARDLAAAASETLASLSARGPCAAARLVLARVALGEGDGARAESLARATHRDLGTHPSGPLPVSLFRLRARAASAGGRTRAARWLYLRAAAHAERHRLGLRSEELKISQIAEAKDVYRDLFAASLADGAGPDALFALAERMGARLLQEESLGASPVLREGSEARRLLDRRNYLCHQLEKRIAEKDEGGTVRLDQARRELAACEAALDRELHKERGDGSAPFRRFRPVPLTEVRRALPDRAAGISYVVAGGHVSAIVFDARGARCVERLCRVEEVERALRLLAFQLRSGVTLGAGARGDPASEEGIRRHAETLTRLLWPEGLELAAGATLFVSPQDVLHRVPFSLLLHGGASLGEVASIVRVPSFSALARPGRARRRRGRGEESSPRPRTRALFLGSRTESLTGIERELRDAAGRYREATLSLNGEAGRDLLIRASGHAAVVHLAGHARYHGERPLLSGILLCDGWLTAHELGALDLDGALVVLSSCESGRIEEPNEEWLGLARGALAAGARAVLSTLWPLSDHHAQAFCARFHAELAAGTSPAEALRRTRRHAREQDIPSHVRASFVVAGDGAHHPLPGGIFR